MELTQADIPGIEGEMLPVTVRLEGQIFDSVEVQLELLTYSQFMSRDSFPSDFMISEDPAERKSIHPMKSTTFSLSLSLSLSLCLMSS